MDKVNKVASIKVINNEVEKALLAALKNLNISVEKEYDEGWRVYSIYGSAGTKYFTYGDAIPGWDFRFDKEE